MCLIAKVLSNRCFNVIKFQVATKLEGAFGKCKDDERRDLLGSFFFFLVIDSNLVRYRILSECCEFISTDGH